MLKSSKRILAVVLALIFVMSSGIVPTAFAYASGDLFRSALQLAI